MTTKTDPRDAAIAAYRAQVNRAYGLRQQRHIPTSVNLFLSTVGEIERATAKLKDKLDQAEQKAVQP